MKKAFLLFALLALLAPVAVAQSFRVSVGIPAGTGGAFALWVYDTDSVPRVLKPTFRDGRAVFTGRVRGASYAELHNAKVGQPLPLFIENADITVAYNAAAPEASPITGSRTNSILRYELEQCGATDAECLARFVADNPSSPVAPYILERYMLSLSDRETVAQLYGQLSGEACSTWHYRRLGRRLAALAALEPGCELPSVAVANLLGWTVRLERFLPQGKYSLLMVGASYCRQCNAVRDTLLRTHPELTVVAFDVDSLGGGWDAPLMQTLDVDHIPFLMLVDPKRRIVARDARVWELERILKSDGYYSGK